MLDQITVEAAKIVKLPTRPESQGRTGKTVNPENAQDIQKLYRRNRRQAVQLILSGESKKCTVPTEEVENRFRRTWELKTCETEIYPYTARTPLNLNPYTEEVRKKIYKFENTAPGNDGLTYNHWKRLDPACALLTCVINTCLKHKKIPANWKETTSILIHKKGDEATLNNWRPIALCRTLYKLYTGCIAARLTEWLVRESHKPKPKGISASGRSV